MQIREARSGEVDLIAELHTDAFGAPEGPQVAQLVVELIADVGAEPRLSLVAEQGGALVGHVLFTPIVVPGAEGVDVRILCPMAVASRCHRSGIGTALIHQALALLKDEGVAAVLVYGDPDYYGRFGFASGHCVAAPYPLEFPDAWRFLALQEGPAAQLQGVARCAPPLMNPVHW